MQIFERSQPKTNCVHQITTFAFWYCWFDKKWTSISIVTLEIILSIQKTVATFKNLNLMV